MSDTDASAPQTSTRRSDGRFGAGNPGKPVGARSRVSRRVVMAILADFENHQAAVLKTLRLQHAVAYAALLSRLLPKHLPLDEGVDGIGELSAQELADVIAEARAALEGMEEMEAARPPRVTANLELAPALAAQVTLLRQGGDAP